MSLSQRTVQVNGQPAHYWVAGVSNGRTLLLLHGGLGDAALHWQPVIPLLADEFHVIAPDLPGFGKTPALPSREIAAMVAWIADFLTAVTVDQAVVIGSSLGGVAARLFAAAHPARVPALILLNGGGLPELPAFLRVLDQLPGVSGLIFGQLGRMGTSKATLRRMVHHQEVLTPDFVAQARAAAPGYAAFLRMLAASPLPKAQTPIVPTLILWGANDQVATVQEAEAIKASIPGATLTKIEECGHLPQLEAPDVFVWQVSNFLDRLSRPKRSELPGAGPLRDLPG